ncbi:Gfo/Idh/MocA family protein [Jiangella asiatica]|uniref:Gfo/Idh/MocA family oxidoreductase n=1 Tax=Jiangella asiatica TaxID=2530372 RepID=A0A4R5CLC2_9ACTN|nr:Gfo/Idh/MocA family oxidoreductase [Jiangella asiatica]TDE01149.1 Gfo/Idh/MocA family oxidoreductase [Jiangella asiatica]
MGLTGEPLRGIMFGAGSIAPHQALAWRAVDEVRIVGVVDREPDRAQRLIDEIGLTGAVASASLDDALAAVGDCADFVDVATPPELHVEHVAAVARRGLHVLCQKPFTPTVAEARQVIHICEEAGVRCVVNENWRWRDWYQEAARILAEGVVGSPRFASFTCHRDLVLPSPDGGLPSLLVRQPYTRTMERLIVFEWGIHLIDVLRMLLGPVRSVYAVVDRTSPLVVGEDRAVIQLEHVSGARSLVDISWGSVTRTDRRLIRGNVEPFVLEGDAGTLELDPFAGDQLSVTTASGTSVADARRGLPPAEAYQRSFESCQRHFAQSLLAGVPAVNEAADNLQPLAAALAVYESAAVGRPVAL